MILENINGEVKPRHILALMGASGSGKTSLLSLLGGRTPPNIEIKGKIMINRELPYTSKIRKRIGFVLQDDLFYDTLTVKETLFYAALLRLPEDMSKQEKKTRINVLMETLGIAKSKDTIIGGFMRRGISGGERKRVSVAHELIINPSILFLDEPTSGLDSSSAYNLMILLKDIASSGRAVMTTIHQPSSRLYNQLDQVMLLHEGKVAYHGNALEAESWFASHGLPLPHGTNLADHIIDCVTLSPVHKVHDIIQVCYNMHAQKYMHVQENDAINVHIGEESTESPPRTLVTQKYVKRIKCFMRDVFGPSEKSWWTRALHTFIMTHKLMRVKRFESFSLDQWFLVFAISVITGLLWFQKGKQNDLMSSLDMIGLIFFLILFPSFRALFSALFCYPGDYRILVKEKPSNMYSMSIYYWARSLSDLPLDISMPSLLVIIVYWLGYLKATASAFFATWTSILLVLFVAQAWGLWIGGLTMEPRKAQTVSTIIILTFLLVGGFYVKNVPVWIGWIKYFSFIYWGNNLITKIQFSDARIEACDGRTSCSVIPQDELQDRLNILADPNARQWPEVVILIAMFIGLRTFAYFTLEWQTFSSFQSL